MIEINKNEEVMEKIFLGDLPPQPILHHDTFRTLMVSIITATAGLLPP